MLLKYLKHYKMKYSKQSGMLALSH